MAPGYDCNIAVFDRHKLADFFQNVFLVGPDMGYGNVEAQNSSSRDSTPRRSHSSSLARDRPCLVRTQ